MPPTVFRATATATAAAHAATAYTAAAHAAAAHAATAHAAAAYALAVIVAVALALALTMTVAATTTMASASGATATAAVAVAAAVAAAVTSVHTKRLDFSSFPLRMSNITRPAVVFWFITGRVRSRVVRASVLGDVSLLWRPEHGVSFGKTGPWRVLSARGITTGGIERRILAQKGSDLA